MNGIKRIDRNYYQVRVYGTDHRTKPPRKVERARWVRGSFAEAQRVRAALKRELEAELAGKGSDMTLTDYVQRWLEVREGALAPSTKAKYVNDLERHILPVLGEYLLHELRPSDVRAMLSADPGAPNSKKNRLAVMRKVAKDAACDGLIDRDFCLGVTVRVPPVYTEAEPNCLDGVRLDRLLHEMPVYWYDVAAMMGFTGLRWGEVSAFHWSEIDLEAAIATVRWSNWKGHLRPPKTERSLRSIPLAERLVTILRERHDRMENAGPVSELVFPTQTGGLHKGTPLNRVLRRACERVGISIRFTPHGLRRTWNDLCRRVASGVVVRSMIGHASQSMTDHYSHVPLAEKRAAAEATANLVRSADSQESGVSAGVEPARAPEVRPKPQ